MVIVEVNIAGLSNEKFRSSNPFLHKEDVGPYWITMSYETYQKIFAETKLPTERVSDFMRPAINRKRINSYQKYKRLDNIKIAS